MAVALVHCRIGRNAVEITIALRIPHLDAFAARQNDTERLVVLGAEARFRRDEIRNRIHLFVTLVAANWHQRPRGLWKGVDPLLYAREPA